MSQKVQKVLNMAHKLEKNIVQRITNRLPNSFSLRYQERGTNDMGRDLSDILANNFQNGSKSFQICHFRPENYGSENKIINPQPSIQFY